MLRQSHTWLGWALNPVPTVLNPMTGEGGLEAQRPTPSEDDHGKGR